MVWVAGAASLVRAFSLIWQRGGGGGNADLSSGSVTACDVVLWSMASRLLCAWSGPRLGMES
jgi:hypothetical protein